MKTISREMKTFSRENKTFSREIKLFSRENETISREIKTFSRENETVSREMKTFSRENETISREIKIFSRENKTISRETVSFSREIVLKNHKSEAESLQRAIRVVDSMYKPMKTCQYRQHAGYQSYQDNKMFSQEGKIMRQPRSSIRVWVCIIRFRLRQTAVFPYFECTRHVVFQYFHTDADVYEATKDPVAHFIAGRAGNSFRPEQGSQHFRRFRLSKVRYFNQTFHKSNPLTYDKDTEKSRTFGGINWRTSFYENKDCQQITSSVAAISNTFVGRYGHSGEPVGSGRVETAGTETDPDGLVHRAAGGL
jgi:hypothetical protein